jgi:predicted ATPase
MLAGRCVSYGQATPYGLVLDLLRQACGLTEADSPTTITASVQQSLQALGLAPAETAPVLLHLLGVPEGAARLAGRSPQEIRAETFATLHQLLRHASQRPPLLVVVENLHWIDPTSEAYLAEVVERLPSVPLLVVTFRPGYRPPWMEKSYATQLALPRLGAADSRCVVQGVLAPAAVPEPLMQDLLAKAAGNPLFLEELAWTVREHGALQLPSDVPDTVLAVLAARIDRLPPAVKRLLQVAAVIGPEVPGPLLQVIADLPEETLHQSLAHLQAAELLYETRLLPEHTYTFKHVLTHEVAYGSLLQEQRCFLHARIVEAMEQLASHRQADQVERLAHHARRGEVWPKAFLYSRQAGAKALAGSAYREAVRCFEQALEALAYFLPDRPTREQVIDLRCDLSYALTPFSQWEQALIHLHRAESIAEELGDHRRLRCVYHRIASTLRQMQDLEAALAYCQKAHAITTALEDVDTQIWSITRWG